MPMFKKLDKFQITEKRDGKVFKTKKVSSKWFKLFDAPEPYEIFTEDGKEFIWVSTSEFYDGPNPPKD